MIHCLCHGFLFVGLFTGKNADILLHLPFDVSCFPFVLASSEYLIFFTGWSIFDVDIRHDRFTPVCLANIPITPPLEAWDWKGRPILPNPALFRSGVIIMDDFSLAGLVIKVVQCSSPDSFSTRLLGDKKKEARDPFFRSLALFHTDFQSYTISILFPSSRFGSSAASSSSRAFAFLMG